MNRPCSIFSVEHDGAFDFLINQVFLVQEPLKFSAKISWKSHFWQHWTQFCFEFSSVYVSLYFWIVNNEEKRSSVTRSGFSWNFGRKFERFLHQKYLINQKIKTTIMFNSKNTTMYQMIIKNTQLIKKSKAPSYSTLKTLHCIRWSAILIF